MSDIFKQASKLKLRIPTKVGNLSVEQLWDMKISDLDELAVSLEEKHAASGRKSFVVKTTEKSRTAKLMFDVVHDVLMTKVAEHEAATLTAARKEKNQQILSLIQSKENEALASKSIEELRTMLEQE